ncbi:ubiquitin ligase activator of nfkb [Anaeramoeba flamelloides]|uniref:Ubiquitin ligase activator of nfkb n=1 Tax=Anaeramoeba flamelloides TaxID=1746091 RepID=A0AAV7YX78_9EUKA|nr:ubiquitin ligase activator of nfkb [Anaeramoeba flamelloides]
MLDDDVWNFCIFFIIVIGLVWFFRIVKEFCSITQIRNSIETNQVVYDPTYSQQFPSTPIFSRPHYETNIKAQENKTKEGSELKSTFETFRFNKESFQCDRTAQSNTFNVSFDFSSTSPKTQVQLFYGVNSRSFKQYLRQLVINRKKMVDQIVEEITLYQKNNKNKKRRVNKKQKATLNKTKKKKNEKKLSQNYLNKLSLNNNDRSSECQFDSSEGFEKMSTDSSSDDISLNQEIDERSFTSHSKANKSQIQLTVETRFKRFLKKKMYTEKTQIIEDIVEINKNDYSSETDPSSDTKGKSGSGSGSEGEIHNDENFKLQDLEKEKEKEKENEKENQEIKEKEKEKENENENDITDDFILDDPNEGLQITVIDFGINEIKKTEKENVNINVNVNDNGILFEKKKKKKKKKKNEKLKKEIIQDFKHFLECSEIQTFEKGELLSYQSENFNCDQLSKIFRSEYEVKNTALYPLIIVIQNSPNFDFSNIDFWENDPELLRSSIIEHFPSSELILAEFSGFQYSPHIRAIFNSFGPNFYRISEVYGDYDESSECVICFSGRKEVILLNCCHLCVCKKCYHQIEKCPICRASYNSYILFKKKK